MASLYQEVTVQPPQSSGSQLRVIFVPRGHRGHSAMSVIRFWFFIVFVGFFFFPLVVASGEEVATDI